MGSACYGSLVTVDKPLSLYHVVHLCQDTSPQQRRNLSLRLSVDSSMPDFYLHLAEAGARETEVDEGL